jgi:hypothetical protein
MATTVGPTVSELLRNSRFEILPLDGIEDQVREPFNEVGRTERWSQRTLNRVSQR